MRIFDWFWSLIIMTACVFIFLVTEPPFEDILDKFDYNCDMVLNKQELPKNLRYRIMARDYNRDGLVNRDEYRGWLNWLQSE